MTLLQWASHPDRFFDFGFRRGGGLRPLNRRTNGTASSPEINRPI
jgi:hypothetical protein